MYKNEKIIPLYSVQDILQLFLFRKIEITINQPAFTSSVGGYSSYLAYPIDPKDVVTRLEAQFHFSSPSRDQVALLFFIGQEGLHEYGSDYVAISYVKGHILLTWDLGSGILNFDMYSNKCQKIKVLCIKSFTWYLMKILHIL